MLEVILVQKSNTAPPKKKLKKDKQKKKKKTKPLKKKKKKEKKSIKTYSTPNYLCYALILYAKKKKTLVEYGDSPLVQKLRIVEHRKRRRTNRKQAFYVQIQMRRIQKKTIIYLSIYLSMQAYTHTHTYICNISSMKAK